MTGYFSNFPKINYFSSNATDITTRVVFANSSLNNPFVFYPYEVNGEERPDQFSYRYYNDSFKEWIVFLGNNYLDPYYDWYLNDTDFNNFINLKYGSYVLAYNKISYYENNWYQSFPYNISVSEFDALPNTLFKYWNPEYDVYNNITSYNRKKSDERITTNSIASYSVQANTFLVDEICTISYSDVANNIGYGQVMSISGNTVYLQHLSGNSISVSNSTSYIYGQESQTNTSFSNPTIIANNLLPEEVIYWSPVSYLQHEINKNEKNKTIQVLDNAYAVGVTKTLTNILTANT